MVFVSEDPTFWSKELYQHATYPLSTKFQYTVINVGSCEAKWKLRQVIIMTYESRIDVGTECRTTFLAVGAATAAYIERHNYPVTFLEDLEDVEAFRECGDVSATFKHLFWSTYIDYSHAVHRGKLIILLRNEKDYGLLVTKNNARLGRCAALIHMQVTDHDVQSKYTNT